MISVINSIVAKPIVEASDVRAKLKAAFERNAEIDENNIAVTVDGENVTLSGDVAVDTSWSAPGVTDVELRVAMPYRTNDDLPMSLRQRLPEHAQDIFREAFNHAFEEHEGDPRQEEAAHRIAWGAVKRSYVKRGDSWVPRA